LRPGHLRAEREEAQFLPSTRKGKKKGGGQAKKKRKAFLWTTTRNSEKGKGRRDYNRNPP